MGPLIKITSESLRLVRITEQARLLPSDTADLERRKAIARRITAQSNQGGYGKHVPVGDIARINKTFSTSQASAQSYSPSLPANAAGSREVSAFFRRSCITASLRPAAAKGADPGRQF